MAPEASAHETHLIESVVQALREDSKALVVQSETPQVKAHFEERLRQTLAEQGEFTTIELVPSGAAGLIEQLNKVLADLPEGSVLLLVTRTQDLTQQEFQMLRNIVGSLPGLRARLLLSLGSATALELQAQAPAFAPRYWFAPASILAPAAGSVRPLDTLPNAPDNVSADDAPAEAPGPFGISKLSYAMVSTVVIVTVLVAWMISTPAQKFLAPKRPASATSPAVAPASGASNAARVSASAAARGPAPASAPGNAADCRFGPAPLPVVRFAMASAPGGPANATPATTVLAVSPIDQKVCVADAAGKVTLYSLRAKQVLAITAVAPVRIMAPDLRRIEFYIQKNRVRLDDSVKDRMELTERR